MDTTTLLALVFFLVVLGGLVGLGIGIIIGMALAGGPATTRSAPTQPPPDMQPHVPTDEHTEASLPLGAAIEPPAVVSMGSVATMTSPPASVQGWPAAEVKQTQGAAAMLSDVALASSLEGEVPPPPSRRAAQWWTVPLAIGIIVLCCLCTFLVAVGVYLVRPSLWHLLR